MADRRPWFVLRVQPQTEIQAEKQVKQLGYDAMAPYADGLRRVRKNNRRWKYPLFTGYLFASWENWQEGWHRVTGKRNAQETISAIYGFLHPIWVPMPYILRPDDVDYLQSIADGKYQPEDMVQKLKVGDRVLIPDGLLQGETGTVEQISGKNATVDVKREKNTLKIKTKLAKLEKV